MKRFLGMLLVIAGTAVLILGTIWITGEIPSDPYYIHPGYDWALVNMLFVASRVIGLILIFLGRKYYLSNDESPRVRRVVGWLMLLSGAALFVFGLFYTYVWTITYRHYDPEFIEGVEMIVIGMVYLFLGLVKVGWLKNAGPGSTAAAGAHTGQASRTTAPEPPPQPKMMVCQDCGKTYPLGQAYCDECGALLKERG